jgi:formate dehydrogenase gamma subunit
MTEPKTDTNGGEMPETYARFSLTQRIEHALFLLSFTTLAVTGLAQKFAANPFGVSVLQALGGIEQTRQIHHIAAISMMFESIYHILAVLYRVVVRGAPLNMIPVTEDIKHLWHDVLYYLGFREHGAHYGRYNYAEKVEYFAVVWGTIIMAITGFIMWNPIATTRVLPGDVIPAAKNAHGNEAILAVLAIIIWHFYHVHLKRFNKSMFTGKLTRQEMEEEHPAELAAIEAGMTPEPPPPDVLRRRRRLFFPIASGLSILLLLGVYGFITFEDTAVTTVPPRETVQVFAPRTPTAVPTITPVPSPTLGDVQRESWEGRFRALFRNRCGTCHGTTAVGGLSLATYEQALEGGESGPAIVPGDPDSSVLVQAQAAGDHPGQLTIEELEQVIDWILAGAPER